MRDFFRRFTRRGRDYRRRKAILLVLLRSQRRVLRELDWREVVEANAPRRTVERVEAWDEEEQKLLDAEAASDLARILPLLDAGQRERWLRETRRGARDLPSAERP